MSEVRALLLVDLVDSTELSSRLGDDAMAAQWVAHDRVARDLLRVWRGREIDKTDGFLLLFANASDGVAYAMAYHRALAALAVPLSARAGLHVGPVILRENNAADIVLGAKPLEVDGVAKPTAARVMALARGGQTLLTADARDELGETVLRVESHGHWLIKGVIEPIELFEVGNVGTAFTPPSDAAKIYRVVRHGESWLPARQIANNLPQQLTSFVGREREVAEVKQLLETNRLLTLLGTGGLGKTRLSLQVAAEVLHDHPDGVWFIELAPLSDLRLVPQAVASVLGVKEEAGRPLIEALLKSAKLQSALITLDNCEHLLPACAELASQLLQARPHLKILCSSREPLHVMGEIAFVLPTLAAPDPQHRFAAEAMMGYEAVRLFSDRARAVQPGFCVTAHNASAVADICHRLDGIPLALELAAARVRGLSLEKIAERLGDRLRLLSRGDQTKLARHQTLRACIAWSVDLLAAPERALLRRLAVFVGGWTLEAAEAVGANNDVDRCDVLDLMTDLVDKSLVIPQAEGARYRLLETVREYANEQLDESGDGNEARARHLAFYLALMEAWDPMLVGPEQSAWQAQIDLERENLLAAHAWCDRADGGAEMGLRLANAFASCNYWFSRGLAGLGYRVTVEALNRLTVKAPSLALCRALLSAGQFGYFMGRYEDAQVYLGEGLAVAGAIDDKDRSSRALTLLGMSSHAQGNAATALAHFDQALALGRELGNKTGVATTLNGLAELHRAEGNLDTAVSCYEESLALLRELGDRFGIATLLINLALVAISSGAHGRAQRLLLEAIAIADETGSKHLGVHVIESCAWLGVTHGEWDFAARLYGAAEALRVETGLRHEPADETLQALILRARDALGAAAFDAAQAAGRELGYEVAMARARAWLDRKLDDPIESKPSLMTRLLDEP